jgi:hypothetical protein
MDKMATVVSFDALWIETRKDKRSALPLQRYAEAASAGGVDASKKEANLDI